MPPAATVIPDSAQHRLSDFLHAELLHTLGAYKSASESLRALRKDLSGKRTDEPLLEAVNQAILHNTLLLKQLHRPHPTSTDARRHPSPLKEEESPRPDPDLLVPVQAFYSAADRALRLHLKTKQEDRKGETYGEVLGRHLARIHDPQRRPAAKPTEGLIEGRQERTRYRLERVEGLQREEPPPTPGLKVYDAGSPEAFRAILDDNLGETSKEGQPPPLHLTILGAMSDAHKWMHQAEHLRSQTFGAMFTEIPQTHAEIQRLLKRSIVLNTFVYVAARSAPWVFSEDPKECAHVISHFDECCENLTPTYCMWIGNQLGLLALERRAYSWWTLGRHDLAYCDFYKLVRLLRGLRRQVSRRAMRVPGTKTLIAGLTATAEHHIGRVYRGQHAHRVALRYFKRASNHLTGWEDDAEIGSILKNSRWRVNLLISHGKANFELGRMKTSLLYYARSWRAFLQLAESESHSTANLDVVEKLIAWLTAIEDEPELSKAELSEQLEPLVGQFETVYSPVHLRLLAADIMMRLGHLLYVLKLPPVGWTLPSDLDDLPPDPDHELSRRCMAQAATLDPTSTLIATDLLKIRHGAHPTDADKPLEQSKEERGGPAIPLGGHWPAGGSRFEEAVRVIEYVIQTWLDGLDRSAYEEADELPPPGEIASELLRSFLAHTDSSNVKLAQVYRYLMQEPREVAGDVGELAPTIEIVCLRRYSSFFPFLPRPAAFRALGGGYLAQVRDAKSKTPFGIAIDPGPDFLDNLYRCGYALSDIHMIVLTHDHADHIASVDALLALIGIRQQLLGKKTFGPDRRLTIVGNKSAVARYRFFNRKHPVKTEALEDDSGATETVPAERPDVVRVMSFAQFQHIAGKQDLIQRRGAIKDERILLTPNTLRIDPIQTVDHLDAMGYVSQGFQLSVGSGPSRSTVVFTSDTGAPIEGAPEETRIDGGPHLAGGRRLDKAVGTADVVVAHLSSVPFPELRELAGPAPSSTESDESTEALEELWAQAAANAASKDEDETIQDGIDETSFLLKQLQFAFRSRGKNDDLAVSPLSSLTRIKKQPERHLFLTGLLDLAKRMASRQRSDELPLLLIGELREELGTFRTRIASRITDAVFDNGKVGTALTADIGLRVRVSRRGRAMGEPASISVLCTTCDLDNDLIASERFHSPKQIREVCVKGENEGVFYNCELHDPGKRPELLWVESVERYAVFGD